MARSTTSADKVADEARARLKLAQDADGGNRAAALEDLKFAAGDQWPQEIEMARKLDRRPCLTINKTDTFVRSTVNNMRQQRPRIVVHPVSDGADEQTAKVIQGLIRHIEVNSNADYAYDLAADFQVRMGWGFIRLCTRYVDDASFDQEIYIDAVKNPFSVYLDPSSTSPDGEDAEWCIVTERIKRTTFQKLYPKAKVNGLAELGGGDDLAEWANKEEIIVAEYFRIESTPDELLMLSTGQTLYGSEYRKAQETYQKAGIYPVHQRETMRRVVKWSKITAVEELESRELPGKRIPVFPVYGAEVMYSGRLVRYGMVRQLKDPQRMYNFWRTQETEFVALAPKAPWLMAEGQDEGREDEWNSANVKNFSSLKYKPILGPDGATIMPAPQRMEPQAIPAASVNAAMAASEDLKAVAGMFDPALGAAGQETSGVMVERRQQQSDLSNFHFYDNLTRTIRAVGKCILEWIPTYYDTQRVIRIIGEDNRPQGVTINESSQADGVSRVLNDVRVGTYDVVMETGPGYQTKREQAFAFMLEMGKAFPPLFQAAGDLIMRQSDNPGASDIADRLAAINPVAQQTKQLPEDIEPKAKSIIVGLLGQVQQLQAQLQQLTMEKQAKVFGVQEREQAITQRTEMQEFAETHRTQMREQAETERTHAEIRERLERERMGDATSLQETLITARTNLAVHHEKAMQHGVPNANRPTRA